jgi:SAM-dependent methyltransferase
MFRQSEVSVPDTATVFPPLPPPELRQLAGHDDSLFQVSSDGALVFPYIADLNFYRSVLDFGCDCGHIARQLMVQNPRPGRYIGIDAHLGMIEWCQRNLTALAPHFEFRRHGDSEPFPAEADTISLVIASAAFTRLAKNQTEFYLGEIARVLSEDGIARTTWFLFDRLTFPMMSDAEISLSVNEAEMARTIIYDWRWLLDVLQIHNLQIVQTVAPELRGNSWVLYLRKAKGLPHEFPLDALTRQSLSGSGAGFAAPENVREHHAGEEHSGLADGEAPANPRYTFSLPAKLSQGEFERRSGELRWWYHSYYFDNGLHIRGDYDIGADVNGYGFPESMKGLRVLDIGTGAGWFSHYFEHRGADVVTVDARGYSDFDVYGRSSVPRFESEGRSPDRFDENGDPIYFSPVSHGFWIMKDLLGSRVKFKNARAYDVSPSLLGGEKFDLVFLGAILCHLRDPIGALIAARSVCRHRVIASTPVVIGETGPDVLPRQYLPYTNDDKISWWLPNEACFKHWFQAAGFIAVDVSRQVTLRSDVVRFVDGRCANGDQILRVGSAFVP